MDTDLMIMLSAGCIALLVIVASAKLATRRKKTPTKSATKDSSDASDDFAIFKKLTAEHPNNPDLWLKWGNALASSANNAKHPNMRLHRYNEACSCFQSAVEKVPNFSPAWKNWGQTLYELYRLQDCTDRLILDNAHTKFQTAVRIAPTDAQLWLLWADELYMTAQAAQGDQKRELHDLATSKLMKAREIDPSITSSWKPSEANETLFTPSDGTQATEAQQTPTSTPSAPLHPNLDGSSSIDVQLPWARGTTAPQEADQWLTENKEEQATPTLGTPEPTPSSLLTPNKPAETSN